MYNFAPGFFEAKKAVSCFRPNCSRITALQAVWADLLSQLHVARIFEMHVCFVKPIQLEPELIKFGSLAAALGRLGTWIRCGNHVAASIMLHEINNCLWWVATLLIISGCSLHELFTTTTATTVALYVPFVGMRVTKH